MDEFIKLLELVLRLFEVGQSPQSFLVLFGLAFTRIVSFLIIVPFFGGEAVPSRVKVATAMALVIVVYPSLTAAIPTDGSPLPFGPIGFTALIVKEAFVGFTLGYVATSVFEAIQVAGRVIDLQRGSTMSELFAPQLQERVSELGQFKLQFAIVIFLTIGAHHLFISALLQSFILIPATGFPNMGQGWSPTLAFLTELTGMMLMIGVQLATPAVLVLLMTDLFFGLINRVSPQINVFFLSLPVKMLVGIYAVLLMLPLLQSQYQYYFIETYKAFETMIRFLAPVK
jgi:flagellar biosynthetic protein FliR